MGRLRKCEFGAVIGIGGIGPQARSQRIDARVNWIGVGPRKEWLQGYRGPLIRFVHFVLFEDRGQMLSEVAPHLARRICSSRGPRFVFSDKLTPSEQIEIARLLAIVKAKPSSPSAAHRRSRLKRNHCKPVKP